MLAWVADINLVTHVILAIPTFVFLRRVTYHQHLLDRCGRFVHRGHRCLDGSFVCDTPQGQGRPVLLHIDSSFLTKTHPVSALK